MKILILGGTRFIGRHLVTAALDRSHEVTLFNRGTSHSPPLPHVETINGDRRSDLAKLKGQSWDVVIDTCGYLPRDVKASAEVLGDLVERYVFISSISAYANLSVIGIEETAPLATLTETQLDQANAIDSAGQSSAVTYGAMYGGLKALCEQAAEKAMPDRVLIIRPGLIVGPDDYTDRFTYWVDRVARRGGEVLAPGRPARYVQFIDARDLAEWTMRQIEGKETGIFNACGLPDNVTMEGLLEECKRVSESDASFSWASDDFLIREKVRSWSEMPLWMPEESAPHMKGLMRINCDKAIGVGLRFRPLSETIRDLLSWRGTNDDNIKLKAGIDADKERELLSKLHPRTDGPLHKNGTTAQSALADE
ncbi:MAG TPA: NAD-dependent epimerase/dehydratase family protein [Pyrinomonadaceae bacterium]|nr:NAD-dependent epimerase/dehydratase family protein [Pyrinomonadaceae bacterium]